MASSLDKQDMKGKRFDSSTSVSTINTVSTYHKTVTMEARQFMHPLQINDELAFETIETLSLSYVYIACFYV